MYKCYFKNISNLLRACSVFSLLMGVMFSIVKNKFYTKNNFKQVRSVNAVSSLIGEIFLIWLLL